MRVFLIFCFLFPLSLHAVGDTILISGNPAPMTISTATAGSQPNSVVDASTTYTVLTLAGSTTITGQLNIAMPSGTTLAVQLQAPPLATSQGSIVMTTTPANLVTNIPALGLSPAFTVTYTFSATVSASPVSNQSVILTLTLI